MKQERLDRRECMEVVSEWVGRTVVGAAFRVFD
jgi:hypothetical protein